MPSKRPSDIQVQTKEVIFNVYTYLKKLAVDQDQPELASHFRQTQKITAEMCGVSLATVARVCVQGKNTATSFTSPRKTYKRARMCTADLDDFVADAVRRTVHGFFDAGERPTSSMVLEAMRKYHGYRGGKTSMGMVLHNLDFRFKRCVDGRKSLVERTDVIAARVQFLRKMISLRRSEDPRPVVYLDETWVDPDRNNSGYTWRGASITGEGLRTPTVMGVRRYVVCHAGSASFGFDNGSKMVLRCGDKNTWDRSPMNATVFETWFADMLAKLPEPCVIVMDNADYHSAPAEDDDSTNSYGTNVENGPRVESAEISLDETTSELQEKAKSTSARVEKNYKVDQMARRMGHEVIRLPPHHCRYSAIEMIWTQVKNRVAYRSSVSGSRDLKTYIDDALDEVTVDDWKKYTDLCGKALEKHLAKEILRDNILEPIVQTVSSDVSSVSEDDELL